MHLLGEVVGLAQLVDELQLGLEPVSVVCFAFEDRLEQVAGAVVALAEAQGDAPLQTADGFGLQLEG